MTYYPPARRDPKAPAIRINLLSDTQTRPTPGMREAMARAEVGDEQFGDDPSVNLLCDRVADLMGNGWEWTRTPFAPFPGFQQFSFYPGYSANFFDGKHFVMKGGSPRTAACMLRRSFRNWFQPHYPYVYAKFRCVEHR